MHSLWITLGFTKRNDPATFYFLQNKERFLYFTSINWFNMYKKLLLIFLMVFCHLAFAQKTVYLNKGLFLPGVHHYGREAIYSDSLAFQLYSQTLEKPSLGKVFWENGSGHANSWKEVTANSENIFDTKGLGTGGYLYLTYRSPASINVLLRITGNSAVYVNGVLHAGDPYGAGWLYLPIRLKKGENEFYVRRYYKTSVSIIFPNKQLGIQTADSTVPHIVLHSQNGVLKGAVVIINSGSKDVRALQLQSMVAGKTVLTTVPPIPALSSRKIIFPFDASSILLEGKYECKLTLLQNHLPVDETKILVEAVDSSAHFSSTFTSNVDGSLQYFAVTPQLNGTKQHAALFLSVHGAGVEAIGQARAYLSKDWGTLVAATNRRPRGFNWEDWGRLDAMEVLDIAKNKFKPDPQRIYLTGHSMGGHGTWFLGATYPGIWAAIAPCSGYPTLKSYGSADGLIPESSKNPYEQLLLRAGNQSDVLKLATNYKALGIYMLHGDSDRVVSVNYARQMKNVLSPFHSDFSYFEYPGGEHWFGNQSVDWPHLFDFFKWHIRLEDSMVNKIDFITASPGISSVDRWAAVIQQIHPLQFSQIQLNRDIAAKTITGSTKNCKRLQLDLSQFGANTPVSILLDQKLPIVYTTNSSADSVLLLSTDKGWVVGASPGFYQKGPHRYGTFKDGFRNNMVFVYGTIGTPKENEWSLNKAKYDAESWYYRGNGAVDIITDKEYSLGQYKDRGVVLYGNHSTNSAWDILLSACPIQVDRNKILAGSNLMTGDDLGAYFVWPIPGSSVASVSVVTGTGLKGMHAAFANQYFAGASGFPDFMIFGLDMLRTGAAAIRTAGFFDNEWKMTTEDLVQ